MSKLKISLISISVIIMVTFAGINLINQNPVDTTQVDMEVKPVQPEVTKDPIKTPVISDKELIKNLDKLLRSQIRFAKDAKGYRSANTMDYVKIIDKRYFIGGTLLAKNNEFMMDILKNRSKNSEQFIGRWQYKIKRTPEKSYAYLYGVAFTCETINFYTSAPVYGSFEGYTRASSPLWFILKEDKGRIIGKISIDGQTYGYNTITTGWYPPYYYH